MSPFQTLQPYHHELACNCLRPGLHAPMVVAHYIETALNVAKSFEKQRSPLLQELYLLRTHHEIINKMCDPLIHNAIRKQCLEQLYKPLLALKRFYYAHNDTEKFLKLEREARVLSHEFNPF
ncbi:hypothetical protein [Pseudoalteromonas sp. GABNS16A]|uniref:hypothetical protein n=2 Tax=Pseudoalteromonas TaxID=53246 RepID=UPI00235997F1|nr:MULTISPECIES: hypothetical protein [unclassified Pseudoalteromonas]MDC9566676.1 hypothetical protein [Pseudoalteromonas sp. GAB2316C]MDC9570918.1 hypothetical protein [Pseudoalteromonas sp. GABNB9D]MDC9575111.1 hypothetical protein [Pseudoalteromonas sp. GABNS16A]MDC9579407.1 hypothetical protein [Pseudoalteromonas sp. GABNS16E]MDC9587142.1 hypothetical protein [Pseudoalteromonas sp. GABNS16C]